MLRDELAAIRGEYRIPVVAIALIRDDGAPELVISGAPSDTPLRWGSITKTVTALAVLALAEQERVDLHDPLHHYIDATLWQNRWSTQPVRVIHLLELTAGFTDLSRAEFDYDKPLSLSQALALKPDHRQTRWPPGLQHSYSNMTPGLSQALIEAVSGQDYATAMHNLVLNPLGMRHASFVPDPRLPGGYQADGRTEIPYWHMTFPAYGALNASIEDLGRLLTSLLGGPGLTAWQRQHMLIPRSSRAARRGFAHDYAAGLYPRVRRGFVWHGHGGDADGYRSRLSLHLPSRRGYVAAINIDQPRALGAIERRLEAFLTADLTPPAKPPPKVLSANELERFTGRYYAASTRFGLQRWQQGAAAGASITLNADATGLLWREGSRSIQLLPVTHTTFRRENDPTDTIAFVHDGRYLYVQGALGNFARVHPCPEFLPAAGCNL